MTNSKRLWLIVLFVTTFIFGMFLGVVMPDDNIPTIAERLNSAEYKFINPLLDFVEDDSGPLLNRELNDLQSNVEDVINKAIEDRKISHASVYYRDLNNGPWFMVGEEYSYTAASLLKVPVMIAYFAEAEENPEILKKQITYEKALENIPTQNIEGANVTIELGKTYTVEELIEIMIIYSDNYAAYLLLENIDPNVVTKVFDDFDVPLGTNKIVVEPFGPRTYSSFLRILYNSTYLSSEYSEKALEILSRSKFSTGMRSVLPTNTPASIKFGVNKEADGDMQLHECGIIYWNKQRPNILCIMTKGRDLDKMTSVIQEVTKKVQDVFLTQ